LYDFLLFTQTIAALGVIPLLVFSWFMVRRCYKKARELDMKTMDEEGTAPA
jgi:hypothetical protein